MDVIQGIDGFFGIRFDCFFKQRIVGLELTIMSGNSLFEDVVILFHDLGTMIEKASYYLFYDVFARSVATGYRQIKFTRLYAITPAQQVAFYPHNLVVYC